ncbi:MAG: hypothetical protein IJU76_06780 [Desulfovibrionaceae bacterium]|nr:hypothetical protein [Desulfovibrionaceae bacterium]
MPAEQEKFLAVVDRMINVVMFENWLRFYFIEEMWDEKDGPDADPHIFLIVPEKAMKKIEEEYPLFLPIAEFMNAKELSFDLSQQAICTYIVENIDGKEIEQDTAASIMDSMAFQVQLQLFNTWVQLHEDQFEKGFTPFADWQSLFSEWKASKSAKELREKLIMASQRVPQSVAEVPTTVQ